MILQILKNITNINFWKGRLFHKVKYIVFHYTANDGDTAYDNTRYFKDVYRGASAHFFVDENEIWQSVEESDTAWAVGDQPSRNGATNRNSISIELCSRRDSNGNYYFLPKTLENGIALGHKLLEKYPEAVICRHYDVTGKRCPRPFVDDEAAWEEFKNKVEEGRPMTKAEKKAMEEQFAAYEKKLTAYEKRIAKLEKDAEATKVSINWNAHIGDDVGGAEAKAMMNDLVKHGDFKGTNKAGYYGLSKQMMRILLIIYRLIKRLFKLNGLKWS